MTHKLLALICISAITACATETQSVPEETPAAPTQPENHVPPVEPGSDGISRAYVERFFEIAEAYTAWGRVDESPAESPYLCRLPSPGRAANVRMSEATEDSEHTRKLYYLYASDRVGYMGLGYKQDVADVLATRITANRISALISLGYKQDVADVLATQDLGYWPPNFEGRAPNPIPVGFTVVKQSFEAVEGPLPHQATWDILSPEQREAIFPQLQMRHKGFIPGPYLDTQLDDGTTYHVGNPAGLYIMTKVGEPETPGTDEGWIYGTLTPEGELTGAGLVENCMGCHAAAQHERLIGFWDRYR